MRALVHTGFGRPFDVLSVQEVDEPPVGPDQVRVRVHASGIAKGVWLITRGWPWIARPMYGWFRPAARVAGLQFAGTVAGYGPGVEGLREGDRVFGVGPGLAEFVTVPAAAVVPMPEAVDFAQAATVPVSGVTAFQALRHAAQVQPGDRVLILGASGGVGSFAVQIARALGAEVTGVASTRHTAAVQALGAAHVVDYTQEDPVDGRQTYQVVMDLAGNRPVLRLRRALAHDGRLIIVGGSGSRLTMGFERTVGAIVRSRFVRERIVGFLSQFSSADLAALGALMGEGRVTPLVHASYPLDAAADAVETAGRTSGRGTPVVIPGG